MMMWMRDDRREERDDSLALSFYFLFLKQRELGFHASNKLGMRAYAVVGPSKSVVRKNRKEKLFEDK